MKRYSLYLCGLLALWACYSPPAVQASCEVQTATVTYPNGAFIGGDLCDANGNKKMSIGGAGGGAVAIDQTTPGTTNGVSLTTLLSGEDQTNNLLMTSGGAVRGTVGNVASGLLIAADCTAHCTPAAYAALPVGSKTFTSTIVSATSADTVVKQTHTYYGANTNTATNDDAVLLCTITFPATTQYLTKKFTQSCPPVTGNWLFYFVISSNTGSGAGVVTGDATATY